MNFTPFFSGALLASSLVFTAGARPHGKEPWPAPAAEKARKNPLASSPAVLQAARAVYTDKCEQCHGERGKGDGPEAMMYDVKPANFSDAKMMAEMTDGEIFWKISEGRQPMPSFKKQLTDLQRWQLVHFLRYFANKPVARAPSKAAKATSPNH